MKQNNMISPFRGGVFLFCFIFFTFFCFFCCRGCLCADGPSEARGTLCVAWAGAETSACCFCIVVLCFLFSFMVFYVPFSMFPF